jgi:hypothetical protein
MGLRSLFHPEGRNEPSERTPARLSALQQGTPRASKGVRSHFGVALLYPPSRALVKEKGNSGRLFEAPLEQARHPIAQAMKQASIDPALIHAFEQTGLLVTEDNQHLIPEQDLRTWVAAVSESRAREAWRG